MSHARLPPSSASRWSVCTASVQFIEANAAILPQEGGEFADEGTTAHAVAAHLLGKGAMPDLSSYTERQQAEMKQYAKEYVEFVLDKVRPGDRLVVEQRVSLFYLPTQRGTVDAAIISPNGDIYICDLKYGAGVSVYAKENKQLSSYAESLIRELEEVQDVPDTGLVTLAIYQPRDRNDSDPARIWALRRGELRTFAEAEIGAPAQLILSGGKTQFVADHDKQCRFCPAKGICRAYGTHGLEALPGASIEAIEQVVLPDPTSLPREQRLKVIAARKALEGWLEAVENQEMTELMAGAPRLGFKLVEGKTNRQWRDEMEADKLLANYLSAEERRKPWEVVSPAQAEKALKGKELSTKFQNLFNAAITRPPGKPSLVPESDKRPALEFNPSAGLHNQDEVDSVI